MHIIFLKTLIKNTNLHKYKLHTRPVQNNLKTDLVLTELVRCLNYNYLPQCNNSFELNELENAPFSSEFSLRLFMMLIVSIVFI